MIQIIRHRDNFLFKDHVQHRSMLEYILPYIETNSRRNILYITLDEGNDGKGER